MKSEVVLSATNLRKSFSQGDKKVQVLTGIDLELGKGETLAIIGVSGSGKSTLLHLLAGLDSPDSGEVILAGHKLSKLSQRELGRLRNEHLGFVYQFHHLMPEFTALENVALPLRIGGCDKAEAMEKAEVFLAAVNLAHRCGHHPAELSGGERQRVAIARALVKTPDVVLADEPTGNLDEENARQIHDLILQLKENLGVAFIVVTHNSLLAEQMDRVGKLHGGKLE